MSYLIGRPENHVSLTPSLGIGGYFRACFFFLYFALLKNTDSVAHHQTDGTNERGLRAAGSWRCCSFRSTPISNYAWIICECNDLGDRPPMNHTSRPPVLRRLHSTPKWVLSVSLWLVCCWCLLLWMRVRRVNSDRANAERTKKMRRGRISCFVSIDRCGVGWPPSGQEGWNVVTVAWVRWFNKYLVHRSQMRLHIEVGSTMWSDFYVRWKIPKCINVFGWQRCQN